MALKPWREIAEPRDDVCTGTFQQAEFAADISAVRKKIASKEYTDPEKFFAMTYITKGMEDLIKSVLRRISGTGGDPVIQLQTSFGGGKTHSLLAIFHIAKQEKPLTSLNGLSKILDELQIFDLPKSRVVVIDGTNQNVSQPIIYGTLKVNTLWGDLAYQLGGIEAYELVKQNDLEGTTPSKDLFIKLLSDYGPAVILMDELVRYISQFRSTGSYLGGTYNSNLSFIQNLTEAVKQVPNAILLASLPNSDKEAGDEHGIDTLNTVSHYFGRIQSIWRPVETQESFEIVRRRLFKPITGDAVRKEICKAFADNYIQNAEHFPPETQESTYLTSLVNAYPIHPELFDRLYNDWSSLPTFQKTRGVLKLMAKIISELWNEGNSDLLIMPGNLPLDDDVKTEFLSYLDAGWDPVIDGDIDGERSEAYRLDSAQPRLGKELACRKVARTIFLGTAPGSQNRLKRGIDKKQIMLGIVQPEQSIAIYSDALDQLSNKLHYLNIGEDQYWFDIKPNLTKEMEERKKRFNLDDTILPEIKKILKDVFKPSGIFEAVHIFTQSSDIPDDKSLRLVILPPGENYNKLINFSTAQPYAKSVLETHGIQLRKYQNRLIFLAAEENCVSRFKDHIVSKLAWESIVEDFEKQALVLDSIQSKHAKDKAVFSAKTAKQSVRECYKHILIPEIICVGREVPKDFEWKELPLNSGSHDPVRDIQKNLQDEEYIIHEWAPVHLNSCLRKWYWNNKHHVTEEEFWDNSCRYLYFSRLSNEGVLHSAIADGQEVKDFFGIAYGFEDEKYTDFRFGTSERHYIKDKAVLLIDPIVAEEYQKSLKPVEPPVDIIGPVIPKPGPVDPTTRTLPPKPISTGPLMKRFYGSVELDPITPANDMMNITEEVIRQFTKLGADVSIKVEITAVDRKGFGPDLQRTVKENTKQLGFNTENTNFAEE